MENRMCFCDSGQSYNHCCGLYLEQGKKAPSALALMRSRYSAFATTNIDYLLATTADAKRQNYNKQDMRDWSESNDWKKLEVLQFTENTVAFKAYYNDSFGIAHEHYEFSTFIFERGEWFYLEGEFAE